MSDAHLVCLRGAPIGTMSLVDDEPTFRFLRSYCEADSRPVLSLSFEESPPSPDVSVRGRSGALPGFFRNLLPEGHLLKLLQSAVESLRHREFHLLSLVGWDLPGAVQVLPDALAENSARLIEPSRGFAFALSGAQFKLVARQNRADRLTIPATGQGGQWIAKFSAPALPELVENEWTLLSWARACALDVPEFELRHSDEFEDPHGVIAAGFRGPVLLVRRFDRNGEERIHQEDFAQVLSLEPEQKYDAEVDETVHYTTIGNIVRAHCGPSDAEEYVRRLVFMLLSGNCDAHTKNWTLLYRSPRRPSLSPLYDAVCTVAYPEFHQRQLALALSSELRLDCVKRAHVIELCARIGLAPGRADEVISSFVPRARAAWASVRSDQRAPARVRRAIDENLSLLAARGL